MRNPDQEREEDMEYCGRCKHPVYSIEVHNEFIHKETE